MSSRNARQGQNVAELAEFLELTVRGIADGFADWTSVLNMDGTGVGWSSASARKFFKFPER